VARFADRREDWGVFGWAEHPPEQEKLFWQRQRP
jgi:hypothetical protein